MPGAVLLGNQDGKGLIPDPARRALHNLPSTGLKHMVIDLIEYPEMGHVGIRCYQKQLDAVTVGDRMKLIERMYLMVNILKSFNVSASLEKVAGEPPTYD